MQETRVPQLACNLVTLNLFSMLKEEEKGSSHDRLEVTSSNSFPTAWIEKTYVLSYIFHIFITLSALLECLILPYATLLCIFPE